MDEMNLKHNVLAICEDEGASRAAYALKLKGCRGTLISSEPLLKRKEWGGLMASMPATRRQTQLH
ncbi:hypothetical protein [Paraburkholderia xenovorans]|uniref:hypothetical protein n=1 Tax=Paraburkholderia xenovorans TaxID=36873 RepID=UPI0038B6E7B9